MMVSTLSKNTLPVKNLSVHTYFCEYKLSKRIVNDWLFFKNQNMYWAKTDDKPIFYLPPIPNLTNYSSGSSKNWLKKLK